GARDASAGARRVARGAGRLQHGAAEAITGAQRLRDGLRPGAESLGELGQAAGEVEKSARTTYETLLAMTVGKADPRYREALEAAGRTHAAASGRHPLTGARVKAGYDGLELALAQARDRVAEAADGADRLASGLAELERGAQRTERGAGELATGVDRLHGGADELASGLLKLERGLRRGAAGTGALTQGSSRMHDGLSRLAHGAGRLDHGLRRLRDGGQALTSGLASGNGRVARLGPELNRGRRSVDGFQRRLARLDSGATGRALDAAPATLRSGYAALAALDTAKRSDRDRASSVISLDDGGSTARMLVVPAVEAGGTRGLYERLVRDARALGDGTGADVAVGGVRAKLIDYDARIAARMPLLVLTLAAASWLALVLVLRALLLSLVAVLLNLLAVAVAFGALAIAFQGEDPLLGGPGYLDVIAVSGIFAVVFGLSIDYQVFLLSRMREAYERHGDPAAAIDDGLHRTGGVVTGAAAIMVAVFLAFSTAPFLSIRQFGVGLAAAVLLDATLIRLVLLPALMRLLGDRAWWLPRWLDRLLPRIDVEPQPTRVARQRA
ncbi:MAG TPA: MMPL family transporter, partial [Solirubrobacteraceae bacterium]|nr:MMPL family transporter [Solirubrobacteraceae bacterium]